MTAPALPTDLFDRTVAPLSEAEPAGPNLEYDADFMALEQAAQGKPEQQFGDTIIAAEEPEWRTVHELADGLAGRTRDLRVTTHRAVSALRLRGLVGLVEGLSILASQLETLWPSVHPQLDPDDAEPAVMRLNALAPLGDDAFLARLRLTPLTGGPAALRLRDVELAFGKNVALAPDEAQPAAAQVGAALAEIAANDPDAAAALTGASDALAAILDAIKSNDAIDQAPDFDRLARLLGTLASAATGSAQGGGGGGGGGGSDGDTSVGGGGGAGGGVSGEIRTRDDAIRALDAVSDWIARNEPTNPAPLLIQRAKRIMGKNFLDIVRDLAPDSIGRVIEMTGAEGES